MHASRGFRPPAAHPRSRRPSQSSASGTSRTSSRGRSRVSGAEGEVNSLRVLRLDALFAVGRMSLAQAVTSASSPLRSPSLVGLRCSSSTSRRPVRGQLVYTLMRRKVTSPFPSSAGMDPVARRHMWDVIARLASRRNCVVVLITQRCVHVSEGGSCVLIELQPSLPDSLRTSALSPRMQHGRV